MDSTCVLDFRAAIRAASLQILAISAPKFYIYYKINLTFHFLKTPFNSLKLNLLLLIFNFNEK